MITTKLINDLKQRTAEFFNLSEELIFSKDRREEVVEARRLLIVYIKEKYNPTLKVTGELLGGMHYSTIIHNLNMHNDYMSYDNLYREKYARFKSYLYFKKELFANNKDLALIIDNYENKQIMDIDFNIYYNELISILNFRNSNINIYEVIRNLLLKSKVDEYTLNDNRLYSFKEIAIILLNDPDPELEFLRDLYKRRMITTRNVIVLAFKILQAKHIASINKIRTELQSTSTELILEKYIDCLNYYILYELYLNAL